MSERLMKLKLHVWRQPTKDQAGAMKDYTVEGISEHMSFLEMMDTLNEQLMNKGEDPIAFDRQNAGLPRTMRHFVGQFAHGLTDSDPDRSIVKSAVVGCL